MMTKVYDDAAWKVVAAERDRLCTALETALESVERIAREDFGPACVARIVDVARTALANMSPAPVQSKPSSVVRALKIIGLNCRFMEPHEISTLAKEALAEAGERLEILDKGTYRKSPIAKAEKAGA